MHIHSRHRGAHPHVVAPQAIIARIEAPSPRTPRHHATTTAAAALAMEVFAQDLSTRPPRMRAERRWRTLLQITDALRAAQAARVAHGDLKPANVFVRHDGSVAVGDWASARLEAQHGSTTDTPSGSPVFMAPEAWASYCARERGRSQRYLVFPADAWSLGVIAMHLALPRLWAVLIDSNPAVRGDIKRRSGPPRAIAGMLRAVKRSCEPCMAQFVGRALDSDPRRRATVAELGLIANVGAATARMRVAGEDRAAAAAALEAFTRHNGAAVGAAEAGEQASAVTGGSAGSPSYDEQLWEADAAEAATAQAHMPTSDFAPVDTSDLDDDATEVGDTAVAAMAPTQVCAC